MEPALHRIATCACGRVSVTVSGDPVLHGICHCTNCKRRTGSAFGISAYFNRDAVVSIMGVTNVYAYRHSTVNQDHERHFCPRCGTTLYWFVSTMPDRIGIAGGCFAPEGLPEPGGSYQHADRERWLGLPGAWQVSE